MFENIYLYEESKLSKFRRDNVAFIFQSYYLLNNLNVVDKII